MITAPGIRGFGFRGAGLRGLEHEIDRAGAIRERALHAIEQHMPAIFERQARAGSAGIHAEMTPAELDMAMREGRGAVALLLSEFVAQADARWWIDTEDYWRTQAGIEQLMMHAVATRHAELLPTAHAARIAKYGSVKKNRLALAAQNGVSDLFGDADCDFAHLIRPAQTGLHELFPLFPIEDGDRAWNLEHTLGLAPDGVRRAVLIDSEGRPAEGGSLTIEEAQFAVIALVAGKSEADAMRAWSDYAGMLTERQRSTRWVQT